MIQIDINNRQTNQPVQQTRLKEAVRKVLLEEGISRATISLAVVDDQTIRDLNRRYLQHDEPTDVLSFELARDEGHLEGEIVVSAETAMETAERLGCRAEDELLLYVIHGALHLVGYDDTSQEARDVMREREQYYLDQWNVKRLANIV